MPPGLAKQQAEQRGETSPKSSSSNSDDRSTAKAEWSGYIPSFEASTPAKSQPSSNSAPQSRAGQARAESQAEEATQKEGFSRFSFGPSSSSRPARKRAPSDGFYASAATESKRREAAPPQSQRQDEEDDEDEYFSKIDKWTKAEMWSRGRFEELS